MLFCVCDHLSSELDLAQVFDGIGKVRRFEEYIHWLWSHLGFFYYSKVEFTTVNTFSNVTGFSYFTMVNTDLVCCGGNGGRMKAKFTIVNFPKGRTIRKVMGREGNF